MDNLSEELQAFSTSIAGEFKKANMWVDEKEWYEPNSWPYHLKAIDDYPQNIGLFTQLKPTYTDWDKECEELKEYLSWCIEKRFINMMHPELLIGPLPAFREWKTQQIINKIRSTPTILRPSSDIFKLPKLSNLFKPFFLRF